MADVTISQLTRGTPTGSSLLPYSQGGTTLAVSPSALLQNVGNIGIGGIPGQKLDVTGNIRLGEASVSNYDNKLQFWNANYANEVASIQAAGNYYLSFNTRNASGALAERMRIDNQGNIGVGTSNPSAKLDVNGSIFTKGYNHIESACLNITQATQTRLQTNTTNNADNAYLEFGLSNDVAFISNNNIFEIITTAPRYGLKIKKSGYLKIDISQDIISSTTPATDGYVQLWIYKNGYRASAHLIRPTNGYWDNLVGSQILQIAENDIITMTINSHVNGYITAIDYHLWSYYNFMFWS